MKKDMKIFYIYLQLSHTQQNEHVGILTEELLKHSKGLICYIGGEYNPLLFYKLKNKINDYSKKFLILS